ncbi:MAG: papain-like cysteine protease family protein [Dysgonomonas sp.]|nr:papain-like cysteine protease family protein [Dysgonomonas sp.]
MSKLKKLKLKDLEPLSVRSYSSNSSGNGSIIDGGELGEVEVWGSASSGSGNSAATCRKCGTPYDGWGMCPKCDYSSGSSSSSQSSGSGWYPWGSGSGSGSGRPSSSGGGSSSSNPGTTSDGCIGPRNFPIPTTIQTMPGECLANCITQLLKFLGKNTSLEQVMFELVKMGCDPFNQGLNNAQSIAAINKYFNTEIHSNWNTLLDVLKKGNTVLSCIPDPKDPTGYHSIVITGVGETNNNQTVIRYYDPYSKEPKYALFKDANGNIPFQDFIEIKSQK